MTPVAWTIGGSDSGGGAGIQADIKAFNALGTHGCSIITALTAQNTLAVSSIEAVSIPMLHAQAKALLEDLPPKAIKTGMLYSADIIKETAKLLSSIKAFKICDPVMVATSGSSLTSTNNIKEAFIKHLLPQIDLLTPNLPEAQALLGIKASDSQIQEQSYIEGLATKLRSLGAKAVLIKGGHNNDLFCNDYFAQDENSFWLSGPRFDTNSTHGTGCTLSAAIAALIAQDYELKDALVIAKAYINQGLRTAKTIGKGHGPIAHGSWPEHFSDIPILISNTMAKLPIETWQNLKAFPDCGTEKIGVYPIVDSSVWLEKLLPLGISTIQLRIKNTNDSETIENEIIKSIEIAKHFNCRLFINDYWQLAVKYGAYGVHLGQEDLDSTDIHALSKANIHLGISTHGYAEVARALAYKSSYIAIGPIFPTSSKNLSSQPQGIENLARWRRTLPYPLVAIAGINLDRLPQVIAVGTDGIAVISDILNDKNPIARAEHWIESWKHHDHSNMAVAKPLR